MGAFLAGLLNEAHKRGDKARDEQTKQRDDEISMYRDAAKQALQQGDTARAAIALKKIDELYKLPKGKSPFAKLGDFLTKVGNKQKEGGQGTGESATSGATEDGQPAAPAPRSAPTGKAGGLPPLDAKAEGQQAGKQAGSEQTGGGHAPGKASGHLVTRAFEKAAHGLGAGITAVSNTLNPKPQELPPLDVAAFPTGGGKEKKIGDYQGEDGKKHFIMQRADNSTYEMDSEGKMTTAGSKFPRVLPPISMSAAQQQAAGGEQFEGMNGQPLDLGKYDQNWQLVPVYVNGKVQYEPTSQGVAHLTVGNEVYAVPKLDVANLGKEGTPLGQARTGTTNLPGYVGMGDDNQIQRVPGQREPATPGATGAGPAGKPAGGGGLTPLTANPDASITAPTHPASGNAIPHASKRVASDPGAPGSKAPKSGAVAKSLPVPVSLWNQQQQIARPVREGATQVFGDPTQPSLRSLKDYATLADDEGARGRLAEAFNITFSDWDREVKSAGGLTHLVETAGGYPQLLAQLQASVREDAVGRLGTDAEKDYYDSVMSSYGAIVGLRSLTKASAAQFSVTSIERELPLAGINTFSTRQYYDQLSRLAEQVYNGTRTMVDQVMPAEEKMYYRAQVEALGKLRDQSKGSKGKGGKGLPPLDGKPAADPAGIYEATPN